MKESDFCTIIKNSLVKGYKIPDESGFQLGAKTTIRCFDGIGMLPEKYFTKDESIDNLFICWEAKFLKKPQAFNFNNIRPWQNEYLQAYSEAKNVKSLLIVGVDFGRADKRAFVFEWGNFMSDLYLKGFSIHKKDLEKLPYNKVSKGVFSFENILNEESLKSFMRV